MRAARIAALLTVVIALAVPVGQASADSIQDKQRQASQLAARIEQLQQQAEILAEDYNQAVEDLSKAEEEVASAKARLTQQEGELSTLRSRMSQFALRSYVFADQSASVAALLDEAALSGQAAGRGGYTAVAMGANVDLTDSLNATLEDTSNQRANLEAKQQYLQQLTQTVAQKRTSVDDAAEAASAALSEVKGDLAELVAAEQQRKIAEAARQQQDEIRRQQAAASAARPAAASTPSARPNPGGGGAAAAPPRATVPEPPARAVPPPSPGAAGAVAAAMSQVGVGYRYASAIPGVAFDCSGLTSWAWGRAGVGLPRNSRAQFAALPKVPIDQLQPGDLVFSGNPIHHVGIYIGGGMQVHASDPTRGVLVSPIRSLVGAARPGG
jgi:cell wall-associated NlpC family hydrolase